MIRNTCLALLLLVSGLATSCSQRSGGPTVQAAAPPLAYSNASLNGTYVFVDPYSGFIGKFVFDGNGNFTGGSMQSGQEIFGCLPADFTGTYTVNSDGSGTGTFNCQAYSSSITLAVAESGNSFVVKGGNPEALAVKQ